MGFALRQLGSPYLYAGMSPVSGFDCSGFVSFVFGHFGVPTPTPRPCSLTWASRCPAPRPGPATLWYLRARPLPALRPAMRASSSRPWAKCPCASCTPPPPSAPRGVKISQVEGSGYERRFMQVRRVL
ncbi:MAG: NlpC/P60 family protein [Hymenobacter sp.]